MQKPNFSKIQKQIEQFCKRNHIIFLALFGSILTSSFRADSDIDLLVRFDREHIPTLFDLVDMESELEALLGYKVDLRTPNDLSPHFRQEVLARAKVIYG